MRLRGLELTECALCIAEALSPRRFTLNQFCSRRQSLNISVSTMERYHRRYRNVRCEDHWATSPTGVFLLLLVIRNPWLKDKSPEERREAATASWDRLEASDRRWAQSTSSRIRRTRDPLSALEGVRATLEATSVHQQ